MSQIDYNPIYTGTTNGTRYAIVSPEGALSVNISSQSASATTKSEYLFSEFNDSLTTGSTIDSGWIDMQEVDKFQLEATSSELINSRIISSSLPNGSGSTITSNTQMVGTFFLFNIIARQRYMKFELENTSTGTTTNNSLAIKASYGSSDKLSVFPVSVEPSDFSQAALVQSIGKGQQPDGDYVNTPADGTAAHSDDTLDADDTYDTGWIDSDGWKSIEIFINSDMPSASEGIKIHYSHDANVTSPATATTVTYTLTQADIDNGFFLLKTYPILDGIKVEYTNGSVAQTRFEFDMVLKNASTQVEEKFSGKIKQNSKGFLFKVGIGQEVGHSSGTKFGFNSDIDIGTTPEDVWEGGGTYTGFPVSTSETIDIFSSSSNDTSAGTGARTIRLYGLDANWNEQTEDIIMNGTSQVTTVGVWRRMNRMKVLTGGSVGANVGTITARHTTTTANVFGSIIAGRNQTSIAGYTVPEGKQLFILNFDVNMGRANGSAGSGEVSLRVRPEGGVFNAVRYNVITDSIIWKENPETALGGFAARTDIKFKVDSVSDNNTQVAATFEYMLIDNGFV